MPAISINNDIKSIVVPGYVAPEIKLFDAADLAGVQQCRIGRHGGGVITVAASSDNAFMVELIDSILPDAEVLALPGTEIGSECGCQFTRHIEILSPPRIPKAFRAHGYQYPRRPKTRITCEHIDRCSFDIETTIMLMPTSPKPTGQIEMESMLDYFGVQASIRNSKENAPFLQSVDWCTDEILERSSFLEVQDSHLEATVLLSMIAYSAQYIDVHKQRLEAVHLLGDFNRDIQFRSYWTS